MFGHYKIAELKTLYIKELFGNKTVWRTERLLFFEVSLIFQLKFLYFECFFAKLISISVNQNHIAPVK